MLCRCWNVAQHTVNLIAVTIEANLPRITSRCDDTCVCVYVCTLHVECMELELNYLTVVILSSKYWNQTHIFG